MKQFKRFMARSLTISSVFLVSCDNQQPKSPLQSIPMTGTTPSSVAPRNTEQGADHPQIPQNATQETAIATPFVQGTPVERVQTPTPSVNPTLTASLSPAPTPDPMITSTPQPTPTVFATPTPMPSPLLTAAPTPVPTQKPTPSPTPTPRHTFTRSFMDQRFEEYSFESGIGPPGVKPSSDNFTPHIYALSVEQQSGDIIGLWMDFDLNNYLVQNNLICSDPNNRDCFEWKACFVYDTANDTWQFDKGLNININKTSENGKDIFGINFSLSHMWWYLNKYYQTSLDSKKYELSFMTGIVLDHDVAQKRFWVVQINDMPQDANGASDTSGNTSGIPYPPVLNSPDGWVADPWTLGMIALQNAMTYSRHGLYFFESDYSDWRLRIHYYSFESPVSERKWVTKEFTLKTGWFRGNPIVSYQGPMVAYSKKDDYLYFMKRDWIQKDGFQSLARIKRIDAVP